MMSPPWKDSPIGCNITNSSIVKTLIASIATGRASAFHLFYKQSCITFHNSRLNNDWKGYDYKRLRDFYHSMVAETLETSCAVFKRVAGRFSSDCGFLDGEKLLCMDGFYDAVKNRTCLVYSFGLCESPTTWIRFQNLDRTFFEQLTIGILSWPWQRWDALYGHMILILTNPPNISIQTSIMTMLELDLPMVTWIIMRTSMSKHSHPFWNKTATRTNRYLVFITMTDVMWWTFN